MSIPETVQTASVQMNDVLDDALICISGNRYSRKKNGWGSPTGRMLSLDTVARLKQRNMIVFRRDRLGNDHPHMTSLGEDRVEGLNRRRVERLRKERAQKAKVEEARP